MNDKIRTVLAGYVALTESERVELMAEIQSIETAGPYTKILKEGRIRDARVHLQFGPLGANCPCCGR